MTMTNDALFVDAGLRAWKAAVDRSDAFFRALDARQLEAQVAPGRNRLIYLWGHMAAVHDRMLPLLDIGPRRHAELDAAFLDAPDQPGSALLPASAIEPIWAEVNAELWKAFTSWSPADWLARHTSVSEADFVKEPHRNRFSVLLSRTAHLASHQGQMVLTSKRSAD
jgi:hypothetical protein